MGGGAAGLDDWAEQFLDFCGGLLVSGCGPGHPQGVSLRGTAGGKECQWALDESGGGVSGFPGLAQGAGALDEVGHGLVGAGDE